MKSRYLDIALALTLISVVISGFAHTWSKTGAMVSYGPIGMSADGRIICAIPSGSRPVISTNWGQTWAIATNSPKGVVNLGGVTVSADGTKIVAFLQTKTNAAQFGIFMSSDYGSNWTQMDFPNVSSSSDYVAGSADVSKLIIATGGGPVYFSTNTGVNWLTSSVPNMNWISVAASADGQRMVGAVNGGGIYFSTNFGAAWTPTNLPVQTWNSVCTSSDGKWIGATGTKSYISSNEGANWITNNFNGRTIACSADGTDWLIAGTQIYTSSDGGVTWVTNSSVGPWYGAAVSADGCEIMAEGGSGSQLWAGRAVPTPQLNIQATDAIPSITWLIPSTNFVLQQNTDLATTNWVTFPNTPALNFTNLQYEVAVSDLTSNGFFRLIAQ